MTTPTVQLTLDDLLAGIKNPAPGPHVVPPEVAARLERLHRDEIRYLHGPVVYHPGWWDAGNILPGYIPQARLDLVLAGEKDLSTLEEALAYLASASLCFPLHRDDAEVMFWLTQTVWEKNNLTSGNQSVWEMLGRDGPFTLTPYLEGEVLNPLRRKIRSAVVRSAKKAPKDLNQTEAP